MEDRKFRARTNVYWGWTVQRECGVGASVPHGGQEVQAKQGYTDMMLTLMLSYMRWGWKAQRPQRGNGLTCRSMCRRNQRCSPNNLVSPSTHLQRGICSHFSEVLCEIAPN